MKNIIDYRQGAGGNTILAHILFACDKVNIPIDNITNPNDGQGNVHRICKYNNTNLDAQHYNQLYFDECNIILEIKTHDWSELLKTKFSYEKWWQAYPTVKNHKQFFNFKFNKFDDAWQEFYKNYKDPSWPECKSYTHLHSLPQYVQEEIKSVYKPAVNVVTQTNFVELLQKSYADELKYCKETYNAPLNGSIIYDLGEYYFNQNFDRLKEVAELLEWSWNKTLSNNFYSWVLSHNKKYLIWLDQMKEQCYNNTNKCTLDWEIAYLNAMREHIGEHSGKTI
jgi:hypothetical protein